MIVDVLDKGAAGSAAASAMVTSFVDRRRAQLHDGREKGSECFNEYFCYVVGIITSEMTMMSTLFLMKESDLVVYFKDRSDNGDVNRLNA